MSGSKFASAFVVFKKSVATIMLLSNLAGCGLLYRGVTPPPGIPPQMPNVVSLDPQNWYTYYSAGIPLHPSVEAGGAWSFEFPSTAAGGHVNSVQTPFRATTPLHNVSITFKVESNAPQYSVLDPRDIPPATVHVFFEQQGDDLSNPDGRWWAQASIYNLGSQDNTAITFVLPLTSDQWTNVVGQYNAQTFYPALANVGWIGVTFGGQYFWAHGVALGGGTAKFVLLDFHVN